VRRMPHRPNQFLIAASRKSCFAVLLLWGKPTAPQTASPNKILIVGWSALAADIGSNLLTGGDPPLGCLSA